MGASRSLGKYRHRLDGREGAMAGTLHTCNVKLGQRSSGCSSSTNSDVECGGEEVADEEAEEEQSTSRASQKDNGRGELNPPHPSKIRTNGVEMSYEGCDIKSTWTK
jgi:hypothetical protein